jgi:hypothetical protein
LLSRRTEELSAISRNLFQGRLVKPWDRCQFGFVRQQEPLGGIDAAQNKRLDSRTAEPTRGEHGAGFEQLTDFGDAEIVSPVTNVDHVPGSPSMPPICACHVAGRNHKPLSYPRFPDDRGAYRIQASLRLTCFIASRWTTGLF